MGPLMFYRDRPAPPDSSHRGRPKRHSSKASSTHWTAAAGPPCRPSENLGSSGLGLPGCSSRCQSLLPVRIQYIHTWCHNGFISSHDTPMILYNVFICIYLYAHLRGACWGKYNVDFDQQSFAKNGTSWRSYLL